MKVEPKSRSATSAEQVLETTSSASSSKVDKVQLMQADFAQGSAMLARLNPPELRQKFARARDQFDLLRMPHAPQIREIEKNLAEVVILASSTDLKKLEDGGYNYEIVKDYSEEVDPREYVSKTNRFKAQLEKLKQSR